MEWADNEELVSIFLEEVDARAATLTIGARNLLKGPVARQVITDLVRDAHTIKGSASMMDRSELAAAAAKLEEAWKTVEEGGHQAPVLGSALLEVSSSLPDAARSETSVPGLREATARLETLLQVGKVEGSPPPPASEPYGLVQSADVAPDQNAAAVELQPGARRKNDSSSALGGLLPTLEGELRGAVVRVDSGGLYALINRIVELGIDIDALEDLTLVEFDGDPARLLAAWRQQIARLADETREMQGDAVALVNVPLGEALDSFNQFVRFLARRLEKSVRFETSGAGLMVDRQIVEMLREPLRHVVVNAVDHGIEPSADRVRMGKPGAGTVRLSAALDDDRLVIAINDDGKGIDWAKVKAEAERQGLPTGPSELTSHLLRQGFSAGEVGADFSGAGDGLSVLADAVDRVSGSISITSEPGLGTTVTVEVPSSLLLQRVVTVRTAGEVVGLIDAAVIDSVALAADEVSVIYENESIPVVRLSSILGEGKDDESRVGLVVNTRSGLVAVGVAEIVGERRLAVKSLGPILGNADHLAGAAFLGGGEILVVVDHHYIGHIARQAPPPASTTKRVLVVDDSSGVRQLIAATLRGHGYDVDVASDADDARGSLANSHFDALVVDYSMPGSSGTELVADLRRAGVLVPIVMVSGVASEDQKRLASQAGVDAYIDKYDFRRGALVDAIDGLLEKAARDG